MHTDNACDLLKPKNPTYREEFFAYLYDAWQRDLGKVGDMTVQALFGKEASRQIKAKIIAKESGIIAGIEEVSYFISQTKRIKCKILQKDGSRVKRGTALLQLEGSIDDILSLERTLLNFLQRMSGIATQTRALRVKAQKINPHIFITSTRKTVLGLLDKKAVCIGGGGTHRLGLYDAILVKSTHLKLLKNNLKTVAQNLKKWKKKTRFIEIEVTNAKQAWTLSQLIQGPFIIMFDNMHPKVIRETVQKIRKIRHDITFEASGGINEKNIKTFAKTGVDILSLGSLTHSVKALDFHLKINEPRW